MCGAESLPQHSPTDDTIHHTHTCKGTHTRTHTHRRTQLLYKAFKQLLRIPIPQNHTYIHAHFPSHPVVHDDFKLLHKGAHFCTHKCTRKSKHTQACVRTHTHTHMQAQEICFEYTTITWVHSLPVYPVESPFFLLSAKRSSLLLSSIRAVLSGALTPSGGQCYHYMCHNH